MRYFAYGTNINPAVISRKGLAYTRRERAVLGDHALRFDKLALRARLPRAVGFANIAFSPGDSVEGALYTMPDDTLRWLDALERCPGHYERIEAEVRTGGGPAGCVTYRARPHRTAEGLLPSRNYINHMLAGGDVLSRDYFAQLERLETYAGECASCHEVEGIIFHDEGGRLYSLCSPCLEARRIWSGALGRRLSILDTEAMMTHLSQTGASYTSVQELIAAVVDQGLLAPGPGGGR